MDVGAAALFESGDDVGQHDDGPRRAALEEREVERRKAAGDAAHQHRLGVRVTGLREMADVVVHVRTGRAETDGLTTAVYGDRDTEVDAALPHRVVVVRAVDAEDVVVHALARRAGNVAGHEGGLEAELADGEVEMLERFGGRVHGDRGGDRDAIAQVTHVLGVVRVERPRRHVAHLGIGLAQYRQAGRGVDDREIDAELGQTLVEQLGHEGRCPIERVAWGAPPGNCLAADRGESQTVLGHEPIGHCRAADLAYVLGDMWDHLEQVSVGVDDRMIELHLRPLVRRVRS